MFHTIHASGESKHIVFCRKFLLNSRCLIIINFRNNRNVCVGGRIKNFMLKVKQDLFLIKFWKKLYFMEMGI